ncbi:MAG: prolipoprotein diacylglyceryl transferase [Flavobacteriales bacterium]
MSLQFIHWNPDPEFINIFGLSIRYYGLLFAIGLISSIYILRRIFENEQIPREHLDKLIAYGMIGIIVGARLGHCLFYEPQYYLANPLEMFLPIAIYPDGSIEVVGYQGLASHGGVIGLLLGAYFYSRKTKQSLISTFDYIAVAAGVCFGFIRLANFMNSEIIGIPTTKPWGVIFEKVDAQPRHPAQLYEGIAYITIFIIMMVLYNRVRGKLDKGFLFGVGIILFFSARFLIEFIKESQVGFEDDLSYNMGQLLSLPFIVFGIWFIIRGFRNAATKKTSLDV